MPKATAPRQLQGPESLYRKTAWCQRRREDCWEECPLPPGPDGRRTTRHQKGNGCSIRSSRRSIGSRPSRWERSDQRNTRKTIGMGRRVAAHAANKPMGEAPARVIKAYHTSDGAKSVSPRMKVMPHKIRPIRLRGDWSRPARRLPRSRARTKAEAPPRSAVSGT